MSKSPRAKGIKQKADDFDPALHRDLKVDREKFEGIVKNLLVTPPTKREDVKVAKKKPAKLIPPEK
jgi:hypothetical protein